MLRQVIKTINTGFIQTCALSQLSFVLFWPYATLFLGLLLTLTLTWKIKKTLRTSLDLTPLFSTSAYARGKVLFQIWIIWEIGAIVSFKTNMAEKDVCRAHAIHFLDFNFSFCMDFLCCWWLLRVKKRINKAVSM